MTLYLPGRQGLFTKPQRGATIDLGHPLTKGMVFCCLFNEGGGASGLTNLVRRSDHTIPGAIHSAAPPTWVGSPYGMAAHCQVSGTANSGGSLQWTDLNNWGSTADTTPATILVWSRMTFTGTPNWGLLSMNGMWFLESGGTNRYDFSGVAAHTNGPQTGINLRVSGAYTMVAGTYDGNIINKLFVNGVLQASTGSAFTSGPPDGTILLNDCSVTSFFQDYVLAVAWNRGLSESEVAQVYADPYGFVLAPAIRRWFSLPPVVTALTVSDLSASRDSGSATLSPSPADGLSPLDLQAMGLSPTWSDLSGAADSGMGTATGLLADGALAVDGQSMAGTATVGDQLGTAEAALGTAAGILADKAGPSEGALATLGPQLGDSLSTREASSSSWSVALADLSASADSGQAALSAALADLFAQADAFTMTSGATLSDVGRPAEAPISLSAMFAAADALGRADSGGAAMGATFNDQQANGDSSTASHLSALADGQSGVDFPLSAVAAGLLDIGRTADAPSSALSLSAVDLQAGADSLAAALHAALVTLVDVLSASDSLSSGLAGSYGDGATVVDQPAMALSSALVDQPHTSDNVGGATTMGLGDLLSGADAWSTALTAALAEAPNPPTEAAVFATALSIATLLLVDRQRASDLLTTASDLNATDALAMVESLTTVGATILSNLVYRLGGQVESQAPGGGVVEANVL